MFKIFTISFNNFPPRMLNFVVDVVDLSLQLIYKLTDLLKFQNRGR